ECFALYRQRHWRDDEATRMAQCAPRGDSLTALHCRASDIQETWRRDVYDPAGLAARLSFLYQAGAGATAVLNLYRCHSQGPFALGEIERLMQVAPLVQLAHGLLARRRERGDGGSAPGQLAHALRRLRLRVAELSTREAEVAARIACGMSLDGIAADLDVAPSTVATLRKRVYAKLAARGLPSGRAQLARLAE
ncbi:MAG: LuxR family transcriptional regulator, partial [Comamonadaceae bacterium]